MRHRLLHLALALTLPLAACRHRPALVDPSRVERAALPREHGLAGVSDLTRATEGGDLLYAIPERDHALIELRVPAGPLAPAAPRIIPLEGVPDGLDTEALAALGEGRFAAGTERADGDHASDAILFIDLAGDAARVTRRIDVPWAAWGEGVRSESNRGIESLCAIDGALWVAGEFTMKEQGARVAPLGRVDPATGAVTPFRLRLTSGTGKIAALACRRTPEGTAEAVAIERHYGVARILRFALPAAPQAAPVEPAVAADLVPLISDVPNLEGIVFDGPDRVLLVSDNQMAMVIGPTWLLRVRL